MMEKYSTYDVYRHKETGKILRVALGEELEKRAEDTSEWEKLEEDPKDEQ